MNKPVLMKNPSSVASGWNAACTDWEMYHDSLLAPLKEVWSQSKDDKMPAESIILMRIRLNELAERLNW